jgi:type II secretory pathway component HofQ
MVLSAEDISMPAKCMFVTAFALTVLSFSVSAADDAEKIDFEITGKPLKYVLGLLAESSGNQIYASNKSDDELNIKTSHKGVTWREALDILAKENGFCVESDPSWGKLMFLTPDPKVTIHAQEKEIGEVLIDAAKQAKRNVIVGIGVEGKTSIQIDNLPFSEALSKILTTRAHAWPGPCNTLLILDAKSVERLREGRKVRTAYINGAKTTEITGLEKIVRVRFQDRKLAAFLETSGVLETPLLYEIGKIAKLHVGLDYPDDPKAQQQYETLSETRMSLNGEELTCRGALELLARRNGLLFDNYGLPDKAVGLQIPPSVSLCLPNADIRKVISNSAGVSRPQINVEFNQELQGQVSVYLENVPTTVIFGPLLNSMGYVTVTDPGEILRINRTEFIARQVTEQGNKTGSISVIFMRADLADAINTIAIQGEQRIEIDESVAKADREVSCRLENVHWKLALESILKNHELTVQEQKDGGYRVVPVKKEK